MSARGRRAYALLVNDQPSERVWRAMKRMAASERRAVSAKQAVDRIRAIVIREGFEELPEPAVRFFAEEYVAMVREANGKR